MPALPEDFAEVHVKFVIWNMFLGVGIVEVWDICGVLSLFVMTD